MEIIELKNSQWLEEVHRIIMSQKPCIAWGIQDTGVVLVSQKKAVDEKLCHDMGYMVYESFNIGGVILTENGDFEIGHFDRPHNGWVKRCAQSLTEWLLSKGFLAEYKDNDVLVDGFKVCGTCVTRYGGIDYTGIHVGINTKLDNIKKICTKPMEKIPKGLSEFGITTKEVKEWFLDFCESENVYTPAAYPQGWEEV